MDKSVGVIERERSFERLFRAHHGAVYRYVARRVEPAAVQDVVADTFLVAWRRLDELTGEPLPWLLGVARRVVANHLRGRARRSALHLRLATESKATNSPDPGNEVGALRALARMSDADREVLMLVAWDGLGSNDAAVVVGCSPAAFRVRLHRARGRFKRALNQESDARLAPHQPDEVRTP